MKEIRVGFVKRDQNWNRNILCHEYSRIRLVQVYPLSRLLHSLLRRFGLQSAFLENTYFGPTVRHVDVLHTWRMLCITRRPWVVVTSVGLPFGWPKKYWNYAFRTMAGDTCRRILFNSHHALEWQQRKLGQWPLLSERIISKCEILPTPQHAIVKDVREKSVPSDRIVLTFVGHHFFRKGGPAVMEGVEVAIRSGVPIHLNVVSRVKKDEFSGVSDSEVTAWQRRLKSTPWVTWYPELPNTQVLDLFRSSHAGILLSFAEAYGYSVLEAQAAGCATITSDIGALPELNEPGCGWILPIKYLGFDIYNSPSLRKVHEALTKELGHLLCQVGSDSARFLQRGAAALSRILRVHDPAAHKRRLESLYLEIVNSCTKSVN